jgi:hypothetical protein
MTLHPITLQRLNITGEYHWRTPYTYANLEWLDTEVAKPTEAELEAEMVAFEAEGGFAKQRAQQKRATAYVAEADPLFFKAQRGEATTDEWTAKVAEIKARFPYPGGEE